MCTVTLVSGTFHSTLVARAVPCPPPIQNSGPVVAPKCSVAFSGSDINLTVYNKFYYSTFMRLRAALL